MTVGKSEMAIKTMDTIHPYGKGFKMNTRMES